MRALKRSVALGGLALSAWAAWPGAALAQPAAASPAPEVRFLGLERGDPRLAAGLSLAVSGLGQYYNGEPEKGNWMLGSLAIFPAAWALDALTGSAYARTFAFVLLATVKGVSVHDAWTHASPPPSPAGGPR